MGVSYLWNLQILLNFQRPVEVSDFVFSVLVMLHSTIQAPLCIQSCCLVSFSAISVMYLAEKCMTLDTVTFLCFDFHVTATLPLLKSLRFASAQNFVLLVRKDSK